MPTFLTLTNRIDTGSDSLFEFRCRVIDQIMIVLDDVSTTDDKFSADLL